MLKEIAIILGAIGSILLIAPLSGWLFYYGFPIYAVSSLPLYFALPFTVLACAIYYIKKLSDNKENVRLQYFAISLILAVALSFIILLMILPYFKPNLVF
jgi:hypothetical protein